VDTLHCCPACGQPDTLIPLGSRDDHPHRWRWWSTALTLLYLCERCDVLLEIDAAPAPRRSWHKVDTIRVLAVAEAVAEDRVGSPDPPPGRSWGGRQAPPAIVSVRSLRS
jgi:hypothetical protein